MNVDFLIVGAGFFGATVAERLASAGKKVLVIDKRDHIGGNCYSEINAAVGVECHKYGSHIFHTSNEHVWNYLNRFSKFNEYRHTVWTTVKDRVFSMPINLATINAYYGLNLRPFEVGAFVEKEKAKTNITTPNNLEEKAISLIGRPLYEAFIKGYTIKQWEKDPCDLSPDIITRLPVRHDYNNRYFNDTYEGIPLDGYTALFECMLDHSKIIIQLDTDYFDIKEKIGNVPTLYTGPIDRFFNYKHGYLDWRTIDFEQEIHEVEDFQGCSVMNYADAEIPFTRIHEFKHYHPERPATETTITFKEFSRVAMPEDEPYYPVNTLKNRTMLKQYQNESIALKNIWLGGRLGSYQYLDMDRTIDYALNFAANLLKKHL